MPSKFDKKKLIKKRYKVQEQLFKHENLKPSVKITNKLFIANGGLLNGISREDLFNFFIQFGSIDDIIMKPGKPYSFLVFSSSSSSEEIFNKFSGHMIFNSQTSQKNIDLFLIPLDEVPSESSSINHFKPEGMILLENYFNENEEKEMLSFVNELNKNSIKKIRNEKNLKLRTVFHFGYEFDYDINGIKTTTVTPPIPQICLKFLEKLQTEKIIESGFNQLTINCYQAGQGIPPHVDNPHFFGEQIVVFSFGSSVVMEFKQDLTSIETSLKIPPRSVVVLTASSRYSWTHGITPRTFDLIHLNSERQEIMKDIKLNHKEKLTLERRGYRVSFTFRKIKADVLEKEKVNDKALDKYFSLVERDHVQKVYNHIGNHFSDTRHTSWPVVKNFIDQLPRDSFVLDAGCGNGKNMKIRNKELIMIGCDNSSNLCQICKTRNLETVMCGITKLPFLNEFFDATICIAVIHHLASKSRRLQAIEELVRVTKKDGKILIYVWAKEQTFEKKKSKYLKNNNTIINNSNLIEHPVKSVSNDKITSQRINFELSLPIHTNKTNFSFQDVLVPWHLKIKDEKIEENSKKHIYKEIDKKESIYHRFYHVFMKDELTELCKLIENVEIIKNFYDQGNWCIELLIK